MVQDNALTTCGLFILSKELVPALVCNLPLRISQATQWASNFSCLVA